MKFLLVVLAFCAAVGFCRAAAPSGCTGGSTGAYECNYASWQIPLKLSQFSPQPQSIIINNVDGPLTNRTFADLAGVNSTNFLTVGTPASLTVICKKGGVLQVEDGTFYGLSWLQSLKIQDCNVVALPANVFADIGSLDRLEFYGGTVDNLVADSLKGLTISKDSTLYEPKGLLSFQSIQLKAGKLPSGFLSSTSLTNEIVFNNVDLFKIDDTLFSSSSNLKKLDLGRNAFTSLPSGIFDGVTGMSTLALDDIKWNCICTNTWIFDWTTTKGVTLTGTLTCKTPTAVADTGFYYYHTTTCVPPVTPAPVWILTTQDAVSLGAVGLTLVIGVVALILAIVLMSKAKSWATKNPSSTDVEKIPPKDGWA